MITITKEAWNDVLSAEKAIVFFHKQGCSQCAAMKPILEKYETSNPDVKVFSFLHTGPQDIIEGCEIHTTYPGIYHFMAGKNVWWTNGLVPEYVLGTSFLPLEKLKIISYDTAKVIHKSKLFVNEKTVLQQLCDISIRIQEDETETEEDKKKLA